MARSARKRSKTGIYHIMCRGIDRRNLFLDDEDREKFLYYLFRAKKISNFELYAYCLMDNHVHILMKESEELGESIKRIAVGYVQWHNNKYARTGHLFQNRYKSEVVENDKHLIAVVRYIHQNPLKAGIVRDMSMYPWSSYNDYISCFNGKTPKIDTDLVMSYFKTERAFCEYMKEPSDDKFLEYKIKKRYTDGELKRKIKKLVDLKNIIKLPRRERDRTISSLYERTGVSIRQLSRVMGIGRGIVQRAVKSNEK